MSRRFTVARLVLGILLLIAAGLKLYGLSVSAVPRVGWFAQPWVQLAAVEWEVILGLWLLSGASPRGSWLASVATFTTFAAVSSYLGFVGVPSCGCFGAVAASPWYAFGVDVAAFGVLAVCRPPLSGWSRDLSWPAVRTAALWAGGTAVAIGGLTLASSTLYGSTDAALARLRGDSAAVADTYLDFGTGAPGEHREATATVHNWSGRPLRVIGGTSDCSCTTLADLPITIEPGGRAEITVRLQVPEGSGRITKTVYLRTDCPKQPRLAFQIGCRIA